MSGEDSLQSQAGRGGPPTRLGSDGEQPHHAALPESSLEVPGSLLIRSYQPEDTVCLF